MKAMERTHYLVSQHQHPPRHFMRPDLVRNIRALRRRLSALEAVLASADEHPLSKHRRNGHSTPPEFTGALVSFAHSTPSPRLRKVESTVEVTQG